MPRTYVGSQWCALQTCLWVLLCTGAFASFGCKKQSGPIQDEATQAHVTPESFTHADEDYFHDMDNGVALSADEVKGRNTWIVWTGGNDRLWDVLTVRSVGTLDFLKTVSSYDPSKDPALTPEKQAELKRLYRSTRDNRFYDLGLLNEPCFEKATGPDPEKYGLWLDKRRADCPPDPFENETKYKGVPFGARGKSIPVGSFYGKASGVIGLRLFPNPAFDEEAQKRWDPVRYYNDPSYYNSKDLVRPYRVGMSCGFCHVGPNPIHPPQDPEHPEWADLSSNVGAQYFWVDRVFAWAYEPSSFPYQLFHTARPGTLDTSLVSTDYINNPRTMNAVYELGGRLDIAKRWGEETLGPGSEDNEQLNTYFPTGPLSEFFKPPRTVWTTHVLKDASDSVGVLGALNRVYINIGTFSEEWLTHFNALVGGKRTTAITIKDARANSSYWRATELQAANMARFFLKSATPHHLKDAPGGAAYLTESPEVLERGKQVFAERCARCHSSKLPPIPREADIAGCAGPNYLSCWDKYWQWTKSDEFKAQMRAMVAAPDFLEGNFLSTDARVPVTLLETYICSPLATNALRNNIWDNFSSESYKNLPSVGEVTVHHPITGEARQYKMPAGGRGYMRPASLISAWSTAPFLQNNAVGKFDPSPSVAGRMRSFQDSIEQMLWPQKRERDPVLGSKVPGVIDRTAERSYLRVARGFLPDLLQPLLGFGQRYFPWVVEDDGLQIGPIPKGTPVGLLSNMQLVNEDVFGEEARAHTKQLIETLLALTNTLRKLPADASDEQASAALSKHVDALIALSRCPDYIQNRGHYFGTDLFKEEPGLSDDDKRALIGFIKTF